MACGLLGAVPSSRVERLAIEVYVSLPDTLPEYLPRGKVVASMRVESYGLQRASWDEVGTVIWVVKRGKNSEF